MGNMREIGIEECRRVSGGAEIVVTGSRITTPVYEQFHDSGNFTYRSFGGFGSSQGGDGGAPTLEAVDGGDDDGDGTLNRDEEIVVSVTPMTPEQSAAYNYHRDVATWTVNAIYYGLLAKTAASGWAGRP